MLCDSDAIAGRDPALTGGGLCDVQRADPSYPPFRPPWVAVCIDRDHVRGEARQSLRAQREFENRVAVQRIYIPDLCGRVGIFREPDEAWMDWIVPDDSVRQRVRGWCWEILVRVCGRVELPNRRNK